MANNYFQFKQFTIQQKKCTMKVCTDACIFCAWVAYKITHCQLPAADCLDIGTGTGLLSLMLAQKNCEVIIDAVEIENNAFEQAKENFKNSPWNERLHIFNTDVKEFITSKKYDIIISNPPFFENDLKSDKKNKNIAKHDDGLNLEELIKIIQQHLNLRGHFAILLSYHRVTYFETLAKQNGFYLKEKLLIRQTPSHNFFRGILFFNREKAELAITELTIKNSEGNYTDEFKELMKDYYLNL